MDFVRIEQLEVPPEQAFRRLKMVLQEQGFGNILKVPAQPAEGEGQQIASTLVIGYASELVSKATAIVPEAPLLLTSTFLLRASGKGTHIGILDPQVLSLVPNQQELQSIVDDLRARTLKVLDQMKTASGNEKGAEGAPEQRAVEVEQRLYDVILRAIEALPKEDLAQNSDKIFVLSKAYTAIASLRRTEELELHLA